MSTAAIADEVRRRRTFAIISHPDAGKTTLTEKLLLFSGAIQIAGSVKARKASRHATSDWMEIEKQRGISVASSVMQMEYRGCVINHAVDWRAAGLDFLLPDGPENPLRAELAQWRDRAERLRISRAPLLISLGEWLRANEPADATLALLHGDPNPGNYLFRGDEVVGVVDWEVAAVGDPRSDLGLLRRTAHHLRGHARPRGETLLSQAYAGVTGRPLHNLEFYEATGLYRMAVVMAGWAGRFTGMASGYSMDAIARRLSVLLGPRWEA